MRLISSEIPWRVKRAKPKGKASLMGQRGSPPTSGDISFPRKEFMAQGQER